MSFICVSMQKMELTRIKLQTPNFLRAYIHMSIIFFSEGTVTNPII